jgi:hypothetical protein
VVFVVVALIAIVGIGGSTPSSDESAAKVFAFYDDHSIRQGVAAFVLAAAVPFLVLFAASLVTGAWRADHDDTTVWRYMLLAGAGLTAAVLLITAMIHFSLADAADNRVSADAVQGLNVLDSNSWVAMNAAFGVMMLGAAGLFLAASAAAPRWLGWVALVLGVALFIPFADFIALILTLVWIIVVGVMLFVRTRVEETAGGAV